MSSLSLLLVKFCALIEHIHLNETIIAALGDMIVIRDKKIVIDWRNDVHLYKNKELDVLSLAYVFEILHIMITHIYSSETIVVA